MAHVFRNVGGGTGATAKLHGTGCLLSPTYLITAKHVVAMMLKKFTFPVVLKYDGLFKCTVESESEVSDVAILRVTEKMKDGGPRPRPASWPVLGHGITLCRGMSVGYMTFLHKIDEQNESRTYPFFSGAYVSFRAQVDNKSMWVLSGGFTESGFSGSPVFDKEGRLLAIATNAFMVNSVVEDCPSVPFVFPQVSEIPAIAPAFVKAIEDSPGQ